MRALIVATAVLLSALSAAAQEGDDVAPPSDLRFRTIVYREDMVVPLRAHLGYQVLIQFDESELIENVAVGDSAAWQVTPNRAATLLFVKPLAAEADTNMTVVTNRRIYSFALSAAEADGPSDPDLVYGVRFSFSEPVIVAPPSPPPPRVVNADYSSRGAPRFRTVRVFDDGAATYFLFQEGMEIPAILAINENGDEEIANTQSRPPYIVVDRIAREFILRADDEWLRVRNDGYGALAASERVPGQGS